MRQTRQQSAVIERRGVESRRLITGLRPLVAALEIVVWAASFRPAIGTEPPAPPQTAVEFAVEKDGHPLTLPVTIAGTSYPFLLDTGASVWMFDDRFEPQLGPEENVVAVGIDGETRQTTVRRSPELGLGPLKLGSQRAKLFPRLHDYFMTEGLDIYGFIGMESLKDKIVFIDFDSGKVTFLDGVGPDAGTPIPLTWKGTVPYVVAEIGGAGQEAFLVDTGESDFGTGYLHKPLFERLLAERKLRPVGSGQSAALTAGGMVRVLHGELARLSVGPFRHDGALMGDNAICSRIGLGFLSRFSVTFDFPRSTMYLRPGKAYHRRDGWNMSDMALTVWDGETLVTGLVAGGAGEAAGLAAMDALVGVDGVRTTDISHFELCRMLTKPGHRKIAFLRDGVRRGTTIVLGVRPQPESPEQRSRGSKGNRERTSETRR